MKSSRTCSPSTGREVLHVARALERSVRRYRKIPSILQSMLGQVYLGGSESQTNRCHALLYSTGSAFHSLYFLRFMMRF